LFQALRYPEAMPDASEPLTAADPADLAAALAIRNKPVDGENRDAFAAI
jgi:hypothetical protein